MTVAGILKYVWLRSNAGYASLKTSPTSPDRLSLIENLQRHPNFFPTPAGSLLYFHGGILAGFFAFCYHVQLMGPFK